MRHGVTRIARLSPHIDGAHLDLLLEWADWDRWRSREASKFWVYVYLLLIRWGEPRHAAHLAVPPPRENHAEMHTWLLRVRAFAARAIGRKRLGHTSDVDLSAKLPRKKAEQCLHIKQRLGDPRWACADALVSIAAKTRTFETEEGLVLCTALLIHGDPITLQRLEPKAAKEPMLAVVLAAHGIEVRDLEAERAGFLDVIRNSPNDDNPKRVYADWLQEQGDPRGDYIQAQLQGIDAPCTPKQKIEWTGPLKDALRTRSEWRDYDPEQAERLPIYRRGFLSACCVESFDGTAATAPEWATVRIVDVIKGLDAIERYPLPNLVALGGIHSRDLAVLLDSRFASQLQGIGLRNVLKKHQATLWDVLAQFENLRFLALDRWWNASAFRTHPLLERIEILSAPTYDDNHQAIKAAVPLCIDWPGGSGLWMPAHDRLLQRLGQ